MKTKMLAIASVLCASCAIFSPGPDGVDLHELAGEIGLYRADIQDVLPLAEPETQAKIVVLLGKVAEVEAALHKAGEGGPIDDVYSAASAALSVADSLMPATPEGSDIRLYIGLARIVLRHLAAGHLEQADAER